MQCNWAVAKKKEGCCGRGRRIQIWMFSVKSSLVSVAWLFDRRLETIQMISCSLGVKARSCNLADSMRVRCRVVVLLLLAKRTACVCLEDGMYRNDGKLQCLVNYAKGWKFVIGLSCPRRSSVFRRGAWLWTACYGGGFKTSSISNSGEPGANVDRGPEVPTTNHPSDCNGIQGVPQEACRSAAECAVTSVLPPPPRCIFCRVNHPKCLGIYLGTYLLK